MFSTWLSAVRWEMTRRAAIWRFDSPSATSRATWRSRGVSGDVSAGAAAALSGAASVSSA